MQDLWRASASDLAKQIAAKQVSSAEVIEAHLARIEAVNPKVNAVVRVLADDARAAAKAADRLVAEGGRLGPLHGVPFTVKENIDMAGLPTTWGVPALASAVVPMDAPVVERMRAAGAIPIGRTNLPDMALRVHTDSSLHGLTRNPWNPGRTAGGSSGGEAAALATGMSPIGLGNDIGGSLRNPANACGIASIRPSMGRVPDAGFVPTEDRLLAVQLMNVQGPMARRVADVRPRTSGAHGLHPRDPWSIDAPFAGKPLARPIRVAVVPAPPGGDVDPAVSGAVRAAADALANAGYDVVEACPPRYEEAVEVWARFILGDYRSVLDRIRPNHGRGGARFPRGRLSGDAAAGGHGCDVGSLCTEGRRRPRVVDLSGHPSACSDPDLDPVAVRARLRCRQRGERRGDPGPHAPGGPGQPAWLAVGVRAGWPGRTEWPANRRPHHRPAAPG